MFERFTDRARRVVVLAQEEARLLDHDHIGTEHVLLGLLSEGDGVGARALASFGISVEPVRERLRDMIGESARGSVAEHIPFTPRAKKVLELSLREALQLGHDHIGTEHILLGLLREGGGAAAEVLVELGVDLPSARAAVVTLLGDDAGSAGPRRAGSHERRRGLQRIFATTPVVRRPGSAPVPAGDVPAGDVPAVEALARIAASASALGAELRAAGVDEASLLDASRLGPAPAPAPAAGASPVVEHWAGMLARALGGPDARPADEPRVVVLLSAHPWGVADAVRGLGADPDALRRQVLSRL